MSQAVAKPSRPNQGRDARRLRLTDLAERTRVLDPSFPLREAAELLLREGARTLLVGEPAGEILGVVDARGLLEALVQGRDPATPVRAVMRAPGQVLPLPLPEAGVEIRGDHLVLTRGGRGSWHRFRSRREKDEIDSTFATGMTRPPVFRRPPASGDYSRRLGIS